MVAAHPGLIGEQDLADVAANALLEIDGGTIDRTRRAILLAHFAELALLDPADPKGSHEGPDG